MRGCAARTSGLLWMFALVLLCCASWTSAAHAAQSVKLRVAFDPDVAGQRTTIELKLRVDGPAGTPPAPMTSLDLQLPTGMGIATTTLGQSNCDSSELIRAGLTGCSANARIGTGSATAVVPVGGRAVDERVSLNAMMGPPVEDHLEVLFYVEGLSPVLARLVLPSVVMSGSPPFGEQLDTTVPLIQTWPEGPDLALETFDSTIGPLGLTYHREVDGRSVPYHPQGVRIPKACPPGGYPFAAVLHFEDGSQRTANYSVPCAKHQRSTTNSRA
jgi:hypothetical protein